MVRYAIAEAEEKEEENDDDDIFIALYPQFGMFNNFFFRKLTTKRVKDKVLFQLSRVLKLSN